MGLYQLFQAPGSFKLYSSPNKGNLNYGNTNQPYIKIPRAGTGVSFSFLNDPSKDFPWFLKELGNLPLNFISGIGGQFSLGFDLTSDSKLRYNPSAWGPDFLTRGNAFGFIRTSDDVLRLTKYFTDDRNPSGKLFIAKQNILSRVSPKTEASYGIAYGLGALNGGIYLPTSTIAQVGVSVIGKNLLKQGIEPTNTIPGLGVIKYQEAIDANQFAGKSSSNNRLIKLSSLPYVSTAGIEILNLKSTYKLSQDTGYFMSYGGGPSSFVGIGKTKIKYATDNTGKKPLKVISTTKDLDSLYPGVTQGPKSTAPIPVTWDRKRLADIPSVSPLKETETREDFRNPLLHPSPVGQQIFLSASPSYNLNATNASGSSTTGNIEKRINYRNPSARGNRSNYIKGKTDLQTGKLMGPSDLINTVPIYFSPAAASDNSLTKDLIDFRIGVYDNSTIGPNPIGLNWLHFRVFLDDFSDSYDAEWKSLEYMGRGEKFYRYGGFKRDISIAFTVAVASKEELIPVYKKLNYLASSIAPFYSPNGYMSGNLSRITLGGWLFEQPGFISSVSFDIPEESPWETKISIGDEKDQYVDQLPHIVNVKMKFTPIHTFRPQIQTLSSQPDANFTENDLVNDIINYGDQRFIALKDTSGISNYDNRTDIAKFQIAQNYSDAARQNELLFQELVNNADPTNEPFGPPNEPFGPPQSP